MGGPNGGQAASLVHCGPGMGVEEQSLGVTLVLLQDAAPGMSPSWARAGPAGLNRFPTWALGWTGFLWGSVPYSSAL